MRRSGKSPVSSPGLLIVLGVALALVAAPVQAAYPSATSVGRALSKAPFASGAVRRAPLPVVSPARKGGPRSVRPQALAVTPAGRPVRSAVAASTGWTALGPLPQTDEVYYSPPTDSRYGAVSGRVTSLVVDPTNPNTIYAGEADGGVWKTTDGGGHWAPLTDTQASLAIGALGISSDGRTIYAGTGEDNFSEDSQYGQGILVSRDGGASWSLTGQTVLAGAHIGSIAVDSTDPLHALAATDIGLFWTIDGQTWTQNTQINGVITPISPSATGPFGVVQVVQAPDNPQQWWAAASDTCANEAGDVLVSNDNGATWGSSFSAVGGESQDADRISLGVGTGGVVYAALGTCNGTLLDVRKLTGTTWTSVKSGLNGLDYFNLFGETTGQAWYDNVIAVDPTNPNVAVFGGVTIVATRDGGATYTDIGKVYSGGYIHPDYHGIGFFAANSFYVGNDGGVWKTTDLGGTASPADWTDLNNTLDTIQFYHGTSLDLAHIVGGSQDNGTSGSLPGAPALPDFQTYLGGDGGYTALDPSHATLFGEYAGGYLLKGSWTLNPADPESPYDNFSPAGPCKDLEPACNDPAAFIAPFRLDQTNPQHLVAGTNKVYQTLDGGTTWSAISPDLTTGTSLFSSPDIITALTMGEQAGQTGIIYTGSFGGKVELTTNYGSTWTDITGNLPTFSFANFAFLAWITSVAFNPANPQEAWVTIGGVGIPHVWHTTNAGATPTNWTPIDGSAGTAIANEPVMTLIQDAARPTTLYVGTYYGVMVCETCTGASPNPVWTSLGAGLPNANVWDLSETSDGSALVAWTHGRGAWVYSLSRHVYLPRIVNRARRP